MNKLLGDRLIREPKERRPWLAGRTEIPYEVWRRVKRRINPLLPLFIERINE
jgi:hypothetical protein